MFDVLTYKSTTELARAIRMGEVSSEEVVQAHVERIKMVNPELNAVVQFTGEAALEEARKADAALASGDRIGPLHGVPMTIKDSFDTAGVISTGGTLGRKTHIPRRDATVVARLRSAGAILMGKTNTPELTLAYETDNLIYGRTNNPYDLSRTPGGSSGGAAAIIAAGGSPFDIGSDTGGSIRYPAHLCGIAGIRPTTGRVPRTGHIVSFDVGALDGWTQIGPMARYVDDLKLLLPLIAGPDWHDPAIVMAPMGDPDSVEVKNLSVAFHVDNGIEPATPEVANLVRAVAESLSDLGCTAEETRPPGTEQTLELMFGLYMADGCSWVYRLLEAAGTAEPGPRLKTFLEQAAKPLSSAEMSQLFARWNRYRSEMLSFLEQYDVIVCPPSAHIALPHGTSSDHFRGFSYTMTYNLTGWPGGVVRAGTSSDGLPIGVQVVGRPWREDVVLAVLKHVENTFGGWQPPML